MKAPDRALSADTGRTCHPHYRALGSGMRELGPELAGAVLGTLEAFLEEAFVSLSLEDEDGGDETQGGLRRLGEGLLAAYSVPGGKAEGLPRRVGGEQTPKDQNACSACTFSPWEMGR